MQGKGKLKKKRRRRRDEGKVSRRKRIKVVSTRIHTLRQPWDWTQARTWPRLAARQSTLVLSRCLPLGLQAWPGANTVTSQAFSPPSTIIIPATHSYDSSPHPSSQPPPPLPTPANTSHRTNRWLKRYYGINVFRRARNSVFLFFRRSQPQRDLWTASRGWIVPAVGSLTGSINGHCN